MNINSFLDMTRDEFVSHVNRNELCPSDFKLNEVVICEEGLNETECNQCWENAIKDVDFFNPLITFEKNSIQILDDLHIVEQQYQELEKGRKNLKDRLLLLMEHYGVDKFENENLSITYVKGTTGTTFDTNTFKIENPELYKLYQKPSVRAASIRFKVK